MDLLCMDLLILLPAAAAAAAIVATHIGSAIAKSGVGYNGGPAGHAGRPHCNMSSHYQCQWHKEGQEGPAQGNSEGSISALVRGTAKTVVGKEDCAQGMV